MVSAGWRPSSVARDRLLLLLLLLHAVKLLLLLLRLVVVVRAAIVRVVAVHRWRRFGVDARRRRLFRRKTVLFSASMPRRHGAASTCRHGPTVVAARSFTFYSQHTCEIRKRKKISQLLYQKKHYLKYVKPLSQ